MRLGYTNIMRFPNGWYGWVETHRTKPQNVDSETIFPDGELSFSVTERDHSYLGLPDSQGKVRLSNLPATYFLVLLMDRFSLEGTRAVNTLDQARKELECCTPDTLFLALGIGMHMREAKAFQRENESGIPLLIDPMETAGSVIDKDELPAVFMLRKTDSGLITMFSCNDLFSGSGPLVKKINDALSGKPGQKCINRK